MATHLVGSFYTTVSVHAKPILVPKRALSEQVDLVMSEEGELYELMQCRIQVFVECFDLLVRTVGRLYRSRRLHPRSAELHGQRRTYAAVPFSLSF